MEQQTTARFSKKHLLLVVFAWLLFMGSILVLVATVLHAKQKVFALYDASITRSEQTYVSDQKRFSFVAVPGVQKPFLVKPRHAYTQASDLWVLVNKAVPISLDYVPSNLKAVSIPTANGEQLFVRQELIEPLRRLYADAEASGVSLMVRSGYRSSAEQAQVRESVGAEYAALPGQSEHQTGLAVDFNSQPVACGSYCSLDATGSLWLAENAHKYGFVLRYKTGKETLTGYQAEPWHYRYVGRDLAQVAYQSGMAYEELYALFQTARPRI